MNNVTNYIKKTYDWGVAEVKSIPTKYATNYNYLFK